MKPDAAIPTWRKENAYERVLACALFLKVHGFISDGERQKVHKRMLAWLQKHGYSPTPTGAPK